MHAPQCLLQHHLQQPARGNGPNVTHRGADDKDTAHGPGGVLLSRKKAETIPFIATWMNLDTAV